MREYAEGSQAGGSLQRSDKTRSSLDRRTRGSETEESSQERRKKKCGVNKHQSRPTCLRRQTSDSSVCEYGGANSVRNDKFDLI